MAHNLFLYHYGCVLLFLFYLKPTEGCLEGWETFGEKCYLFSKMQYGWESAKEYCEIFGANLVKIDDAAEDGYMRKKLSESNVRYAWIGARFDPVTREHRWLDGSVMAYDGWAPGQPGSDQGCVDYLQKYNYRWNSHCDCEHTRGTFICEKGCQTGWNMFGNKCYLFSESTLSWEDAKTQCESADGNLVVVETEEENEYIRQKISGLSIGTAWVGALFDPRIAEYRWLDGTSMTVNGWGPGRPGSTKGCVEYYGRYDYLWNSRGNCLHSKSPFICETRCEVGWEKFGDKCYLFSQVYRGWEDAKAYCESVDASLVKVENEEEHQYIRQKISDAKLVYVWIGARFDSGHNEHRWVDGSRLTFNGWAPGQPHTTCADGCIDYLQKFDYHWNCHCDCIRTRGPFICQRELKPMHGTPVDVEVAPAPDIGMNIFTTETKDITRVDTGVTHMPILDKDNLPAVNINPSVNSQTDPTETSPTPHQPDITRVDTGVTHKPILDRDKLPVININPSVDSQTDTTETTSIPEETDIARIDTGVTHKPILDRDNLPVVNINPSVSSQTDTTEKPSIPEETDITGVDTGVTHKPIIDGDKLPVVNINPTIDSQPDTVETTSIQQETGLAGTSGVISRMQHGESLTYLCNPDDSIDVFDLPENSSYLALQTTQAGTQNFCTVSSTNDTSVRITGCTKNLPIILSYGSYDSMESNGIHGGKSLTTVSIVCRELPDDGVLHKVDNTINADLTIDSEETLSPTYQVSSSLNTTETQVGNPVAWTLSFPEQYVLEVSNCTAEPGTINRPDLKIPLISTGGCNLNGDLITNFKDNTDGTAVATITAFKFYNDESILLKCQVVVCPNVDANTCDTTCSRQKRDISRRTYRGVRKTYSTSVRSRMHVVDSNSAGSRLGYTVALSVAVFLLINLLKMDTC